jgi:MoaD family protein
MEIMVHYFTVLRELTKKRQEKIKFKEGSTVKDLLAVLAKSYGARFKSHVSSQKRKKGLQLVLLLNNQDITQLDGLKTTLHDGDTISLILPIAGG